MEKVLDSTLSRHGIRLLKGESISSALDLRSGSAGHFTQGLILTNRRVIHVSRRSRRSAITAVLEDIPSMAINHKPMDSAVIFFGIAVTIQGVLAVAFSGQLTSFADVPDVPDVPDNLGLFIGAPVALFGVILSVWGLSTGSTQIVLQLGNREIYADLKSSALEDAEGFVADFFEAKS